ncbi:hypothetical protein [Actinophytocola sp.]|uniref:hypothetical protein n=1 Tax=Actinophytocola sp. TaxID=1872138 RepID=UPI00389AA21D
MTRIGEILESTGLEVVTPVPDEPEGPWSVEMSTDLKRKASRRHIAHIRHHATAAVLVVNVDRDGVRNYVGPNSFAEISIAFADDRQVFLLQGMPEYYADELAAWGVNCLQGDLRPLVRDLGGRHEIDWPGWQDLFGVPVA